MSEGNDGLFGRWGLNELVPSEGLPFNVETGSPNRQTEDDGEQLSVAQVLDQVRWDYDPEVEQMTSGRLPVQDFFAAFQW